MRKFWAVVKREYVQRVRTKMFILTTVLAPLIISLFVLAPALIFSIKAGGPVRIAVVDETGKTYANLYNALNDADDSDKADALDSFQKQEASEGVQQSIEERKANVVLEEVRPDGMSLNELRTELDQRL